jgi:hypothetical protein
MAMRAPSRWPADQQWQIEMLEVQMDPSHRIAGDMLIIGWEAEPAAVRRLVPEPLELDGSGRCYLWSFDGWFYSDHNNTEFISPERYNYVESYFLVPCDYQGTRYYYSCLSWCNRDWLCYRGRMAGMPHKLADVQMTKFHPADPVYNEPHEGVRICVRVDNLGLVLRATVDLKYKCGPDDLPFPLTPHVKHLGRRFVWDVVADKPVLNDLVAHHGDNRTPGDVWRGDASLTFYDAEGDNVLPFQPKRMIGGWFHRHLFNHRSTPPHTIYTFPD